MKKVAFLDRDGVINYEPGHYTCSVNDFVINDGIGKAIKLLKDNGFLVIIISNQGGIAKGLYSVADVLTMHKKLQDFLLDYDTFVDDFFFCPHHDDVGKCLCRKPNSLMFEKALYLYKADPKLSFVIGDSRRDIEAANKVGIEGFFVESNVNILPLCKKIIKI